MRPRFAFFLARKPFAKMLRFDVAFQLFLSRLQLVLLGTQFVANKAWEEETPVAIAACQLRQGT